MDVLAEYITKTVKIEDEEVTFKKLSTQDQVDLEKVQDVMERAIVIIMKSVIRWTFKNDKNQPLPINRDKILLIRSDVITLLGLEIMEYNKPKKSNG